MLGGDCSIVLGNLLALSRRGRHGLLFIDGHADFYQPEAEPNGEAASMDLALATGRGPNIVADLEGRRPLVRDEDVVQVGRRDAEEAERAGSQRIEETSIAVIDLQTLRQLGSDVAAQKAIELLARPELDGFWIHLDCDALDDAVMPAVDYRLPGGLTWTELETVIRAAITSGSALGLEVTIFNPALDDDGSIRAPLSAVSLASSVTPTLDLLCAPERSRHPTDAHTRRRHTYILPADGDFRQMCRQYASGREPEHVLRYARDRSGVAGGH